MARNAKIAQERHAFLMHLARVTELIVHQLLAAEKSVEIPLPQGIPMPEGMARFLFLKSQGRVQGRPWRILTAAAEGRVRVVIQVNRKLTKGGEPVYSRSVIGIFQNQLPVNATTILADSTADREDLETLIERAVVDITPCGRLERKKLALQIPKDVLRTTAGKSVQNIVRGILAEFGPQRLGIICHSPHRKSIEALADARIARIVHFGEGPDRSDNSWTRTCDLICVLGTPRAGPDSVRRELIRLGEMAAAEINEPQWMAYLWTGQTSEGEPALITGRKYQDERWQRSFESLCRAELIQCLGRGRTILETGIPVVVVSTEAGLDLPIHGDSQRINEGADQVLKALRELAPKGQDSEVNCKNNLLGITSESPPVKTRAIAFRCGLTTRAVNGYLRDLASLGLVVRYGNAGWLPAACGSHSSAEAQAEQAPSPTEVSHAN